MYGDRLERHMKTIGCIGVGNMGGAICTAICKKNSGQVLVCDLDAAKTAHFTETYGAAAVDSRTVAEVADCIVLGIKPQYLDSVLAEFRDVLALRIKKGERPIVITMAAGITMAHIREALDCAALPVIRIMPNIPVSVGCGMILYACTDNVTAEETAAFLELFSLAGILDPLPENLIDAGTAVSGCGPAFLCLVLEAMADGGVACGLPRQKAMLYAAQTLYGTAASLMETGKHPAVCKDEVCSPGGSTIAGVRAMEEHGVRAGMMAAVVAAYEKNLGLKK